MRRRPRTRLRPRQANIRRRKPCGFVFDPADGRMWEIVTADTWDPGRRLGEVIVRYFGEPHDGKAGV